MGYREAQGYRSGAGKSEAQSLVLGLLNTLAQLRALLELRMEWGLQVVDLGLALGKGRELGCWGAALAGSKVISPWVVTGSRLELGGGHGLEQRKAV